MHPIFTKINRVRSMATYNTNTKFELNRMHRLDAIVFNHSDTHTHTHAHAHTHTCIHHPENGKNEFRRPQYVKNTSKSQNRIFL